MLLFNLHSKIYIPASLEVASSGESLYRAAKDNNGWGDSEMTTRLTFFVTPLLSVYFLSENTLKLSKYLVTLLKKYYSSSLFEPKVDW